jgi:4-hydroxybenzoate polyprenyltransferase
VNDSAPFGGVDLMPPSPATPIPAVPAAGPVPLPIPLMTRVRAHLSIARFDHITKNVFVLPGIAIPLSVDRSLATWDLLPKILIGFVALSLVACSNYVINEVLDAPFDRFHPTKRMRPVVAGLVNIPLAYVQWILMMLLGVGLGTLVSRPFVYALVALWVMGCVYNFPPIRTKDLPYLDVISESVNNPLRMLLGWFMVAPLLIPPVSLLVSYWMVGCYFMALKRFCEFRDIGDTSRAAAYRKSFAYYTEPSLMVSVMFYASAAMLFFGAFIIRYRIELVLTFPLVALVMAIYLRLAYHSGSAVQNPEKLHRSKLLMGSVGLCFAAMVILLWVDIPFLNQLFRPTLPTSSIHSR